MRRSKRARYKLASLELASHYKSEIQRRARLIADTPIVVQ
jgi:hypothetical protein